MASISQMLKDADPRILGSFLMFLRVFGPEELRKKIPVTQLKYFDTTVLNAVFSLACIKSSSYKESDRARMRPFESYMRGVLKKKLHSTGCLHEEGRSYRALGT